MARGLDKHQERQAAISALGKTISRRAGSKCELCAGDLDCKVVEVPPIGEEPDDEAAILACSRCRELLESRRLPRDASDYRFLEGAAWADPLPVKVAAVTQLRRLAAGGVGWATECLDGLWLPEDVTERLGE